MADNQQISKLNIKGTVFDIVDEYARSKIYEAPTYTAKSSGLYKITVDGGGHVSATAAVTASDLPSHTHDHSHTQYLTAHQSLAHSHSQYANTSHSHLQYITTVGTGLTKSGQSISLNKAAIDSDSSSPRVLGGILPYNAYNFDMTNYIQNITPDSSANDNYGITVDANGLAFVGLPDFSLTSHSHSQYLTSLAHSHSQYATTSHSHSNYLTAHQNLAHSHSNYLTAHQSLAHSHSQYAFGTGTLANLTGATSSTDNTGKLWGAYTLVQWMSDIIGADLSAISSTSAEIEKILEDNDVSTGLLKRISSLETNKANKSATVSTITYDTTNKKITKTINGTTTDVVTAATIVTDGGGIKSLAHSHTQYLTSLSHSHTEYITTNGTGLSKNGQTLSLKTASTTEIGGIKVSFTTANNTANIADVTGSSVEYGVSLDKNNLAYVTLPDFSLTSHSHSQYLTSLGHSHSQYLTAHQSLAHSHTQYSTTDHSHTQYITTNGTGLSKSGQTLNLKAATTTEIGGIKVKAVGTTAVTTVGDGGTFYGVNVDKNNLAYVALELGHSHSNYLTSLAHSHTQYLTAHQSLSHKHSEYVRLDNVWYNSTTKTLNIGVAPA